MEKAVNFSCQHQRTGQEWILARKHNSATTQWKWISPGDLCVVGNQEIWWGSAGVNSFLPWLPRDLQSIVAITMSSLRNNWYGFVEPVTNLLSTTFYSIMKLFSSLHDFTCLEVFLWILPMPILSQSQDKRWNKMLYFVNFYSLVSLPSYTAGSILFIALELSPALLGWAWPVQSTWWLTSTSHIPPNS